MRILLEIINFVNKLIKYLEFDVVDALKNIDDVEIINSNNKSDFEFYRIVGMNKLFG